MEEHTLAVQRMQDYIDKHLAEEITLSDLARVSLFSPWYAYRLFREKVGLTPAGYIRKLRLSRAAVRLRDGDAGSSTWPLTWASAAWTPSPGPSSGSSA